MSQSPKTKKRQKHSTPRSLKCSRDTCWRYWFHCIISGRKVSLLRTQTRQVCGTVILDAATEGPTFGAQERRGGQVKRPWQESASAFWNSRNKMQCLYSVIKWEIKLLLLLFPPFIWVQNNYAFWSDLRYNELRITLSSESDIQACVSLRNAYPV